MSGGRGAMSNHVPDGIRPEARALTINVQLRGWGVSAEFCGREDQLIAAGVADPEWFDALRANKSGTKNGATQFGDRFMLRRSRDGRFDLPLWLYYEIADIPTKKDRRPPKWWRAHGVEVERLVADAISKARRHAEGADGAP